MHFREWNVCIFIHISLKFVPKGPIDNNSSLVQIMAWRQTGHKPLLKECWPSSQTHLWGTRERWVSLQFHWNLPGANELNSFSTYIVLLINVYHQGYIFPIPPIPGPLYFVPQAPWQPAAPAHMVMAPHPACPCHQLPHSVLGQPPLAVLLYDSYTSLHNAGDQLL